LVTKLDVTRRSIVAARLTSLSFWVIATCAGVLLIDRAAVWSSGVGVASRLTLDPLGLAVIVGCATLVFGLVLELRRIPSLLAVASLLDRAHGSDERFRTAVETASRVPADECVGIRGAILERLWRDAESTTAALPALRRPRHSVPLSALVAVATVASALSIPSRSEGAEPGGASASRVTVREEGSSGPGATAHMSPDLAHVADQIRHVAAAISADARVWSDPVLADLAKDVAAVADAITSDGLDAAEASKRLDWVIHQIDGAYAAAPVRRDALMGALVDTSLTVSAEASGVGDPTIDDGRPEVAITGEADAHGVEDDVAVHVPSDPNFERRGVVDDAGGGPGDPARNLGEGGFVETNVNLERTTTVGFDPYDQDLDAVRSQLATLQDAPGEGMRAMAGAGGDGDAGAHRADLFGEALTSLDLTRWAAFEREIVELPEGQIGRGTIHLAAPNVSAGVASDRWFDGAEHDAGDLGARRRETASARDYVAASAIGIAERYFWSRRQVARESREVGE
jgi:hypothetical protein